jgi:hypothetical protein
MLSTHVAGPKPARRQLATVVGSRVSFIIVVLTAFRVGIFIPPHLVRAS